MKTQISAWIDEDLAVRWRLTAKAVEMSQQEIVEKALQEYLDRLGVEIEIKVLGDED